jgi:hypothetical protein
MWEPTRPVEPMMAVEVVEEVDILVLLFFGVSSVDGSRMFESWCW